VVGKESTRALKTTEISLQLIDYILELDGASLTELMEVSGLAKSTVHSHLNTLAKHGYVVNKNNRYYLGAKFCHLGEYVRTQKDFHRIAEDIVSDLAEKTTREVDFAVEENGRVVSLYGDLNYAHSSDYLTELSSFYINTSASGKAIAGEYDEERLRSIVEQWGLPTPTEQSIATLDELLEELKQVREQGYAISSGEAIEGLWVVGKAVKSPRDDVCGALTISAPTYAVDDKTKQTLIEQLKRASEEFEVELAGMYPTLSSTDTKT
jgi:IclR family acetate operon transcriptional repressor